MNRGVILIAAGHPYYSHMAYNLALSIRHHSDVPIVLFYEGAGINYLFEDQKEIFTDIQELPEEFYMNEGNPHYVKPKIHLYDLTPFDETIFLDADMIFSPFKMIEDLFEENKNREIQFACRGEKRMDEATKSEWVNLSEIQNIHGFNHWYEVSSEVIYWKQGEVAQMFFDTAIDYYSNHGMNIKRWVGDKLEEKENAIQEFAGGVPDEVPFSLALEKTGVKIVAPYIPSYWQPAYFTKIIPDLDIKKNFYLVSAGGAMVQSNIKRIYDNLAKHYTQNTTKKRSFYQLIPKQKILAERKKI